MRIEEKVVLITGASEGIGAACAEAFRRRGARLALIARSKDKLERVAGKDALAFTGDLTLEDDRRRFVQAAFSRFGTIDILINNAGVGLYSPSWQAPLDEVRKMYELNLFAALGMIQLVVPHMRSRSSGFVVNVSSIAGKITLPWLTLYSASKHALGSLTDGLRMELRRDGIQAMTVCPGYVSTAFQDHILMGRVPQSVVRSKMFRITAAQCAEAIAHGVESDSRVVVTPRASGWIFVALACLFPSFVDRRLENLNNRGTEQ